MAAAAMLLPEDIVREILLRVSTDKATLFRCATTCKHWRALVADRSFILRCWPDHVGHQSSLLGFFDLPKGHMEVSTGRPLVFVPPLAGSVLGAQPRFLASLIRGAPDGILDDAILELAQGGLLLLRLLRGDHFKSVHLAVCDPLAGTCSVLPPIKCKVAHISCAIFTDADFRSLKGQRERRTTFFKVSAIVADNMDIDNRKYSHYMFSSTNARWSRPRKCFDNHGIFYLRSRNAVVFHDVAHWFVNYLNEEDYVRKYYIYNVNAKTGHQSLTELSIPANQLNTRGFGGAETLSVDVNGSLSLLFIYKKAGIWRLDIWSRQSNANSNIWLLVKVLDLKPPRQEWDPKHLLLWSGEKSGILFVKDEYRSVYRINVETGLMEEEQYQNGLSVSAVPMEIDWPALFASLSC